MEYWERLHGRLMTRAMDLLDGDYDDAKESMQDAALERLPPEARRLGRLQPGAAAYIVSFDTGAIQDKATYRTPAEPSVGVRYLLVAGTVGWLAGLACRIIVGAAVQLRILGAPPISQSNRGSGFS